ncbi:hypothetical protein OAC38_03630, partial [Candidatus Poseidoniaceae archaeon]|nr:hypothetical protein [Candidatus Poseidoniaceae archaeon]
YSWVIMDMSSNGNKGVWVPHSFLLAFIRNIVSSGFDLPPMVSQYSYLTLISICLGVEFS